MEPNYGDYQQAPSTSPPAGYTGGVWPPPPTTEAVVFAMPFKTVFQRFEGSVPEFRKGGIELHTDGLTVSGKCVPRYEIQVPILLVCLPLRLFVIAYLIMEYAVRRDEVLRLSWQNVRQIVVNPKKRLACFVYDAPNYKGILKTFSLTTRMDQPTFDAFMPTISQLAVTPISEGKLRSWTSPPVWIFLGTIIVALIVIGVFAATGQLGK